jgi:hypothetical protein
MSPEAQQIAIAKACGWTKVRRFSETATFPGWIPPGGKFPKPKLPDYLNDLNAMHEAEKILTYEQKNIYRRWLECLYRQEDESEHECEWHATAAQRAEAFLRTLNLWTDET